jgi:UDP-3-O-acyl N-acetylglucosamine deacetylase
MLLEGVSHPLGNCGMHHLMDTLRNQRTIAGTARVEGFGYWSGQDVGVEFRPADVDTGVVFVRADLAGRPRIPVSLDHWVETPRRTTLRRAHVAVEMIEHVMAALVGLRVDNCEVWVDAAEMPGLDGSAEPFAAALESAGIVGQPAPRPVRVVRDVIRLGTAESWIEVRPANRPSLQLEYQLDYGQTSPIGRQTLNLALNPQSFREHLAPCRTFMLKEEAEWLLARGLCKRASVRDLLVFGPEGPIDNQLRFADECVRHKLLDMVGDLGLAGCDLVGQFVAHRSGHRHNAELVRAVIAQSELRSAWRRCA